MSATETTTAWPVSRVLRTSAALGALAWLAFFAVTLPGAPTMALVERVVLFATLVITPLGLALALPASPDAVSAFLLRAIAVAQPVAACALMASLVSLPGARAGWLALPWTLVTGLVGLLGLARARAVLREGVRLEEAGVVLALLYLPVGGAWFLAGRAGWTVMGFRDLLATLTGAHFHFAGFASPLIAGLAGRRLRARGSTGGLYRVGASVVIATPPVVALGIVASPLIEVASAFVLAAGTLSLAAVLATRVAPAVGGVFPRVLFTIAATSLLATMALACTYALGEFTHQRYVLIGTMAATHGIANAFGYALCALVGFTLAGATPSRSRTSSSGD